MGLNVVGVPASARLAGPASQVVAHAPWAFRTKAEQVSDVTLQQPKQGPGQKALAPRVTTEYPTLETSAPMGAAPRPASDSGADSEGSHAAVG